jgi:hypothetical protein
MGGNTARPSSGAAQGRTPPLSIIAAMETMTTWPKAFIERWQGVTASELATAQTFVMDLCELLGVPKPPKFDTYDTQVLDS